MDIIFYTQHAPLTEILLPVPSKHHFWVTGSLLLLLLQTFALLHEFALSFLQLVPSSFLLLQLLSNPLSNKHDSYNCDSPLSTVADFD